MILFFLLLSRQSYPLLTMEKFNSSDSYLIFHYIEREGSRCELCKAIEKRLPELKMDIYKLNPYKQVHLGLRFLVVRFPSFTLHDNNKFYKLNVSTFAELIDVINGRKWTEHTQVYPKSLFTRAILFLFLPIAQFGVKTVWIVDYVPHWVMAIFIVLLGTLFFKSLYEIFDKD